jgi:methylated-DNA-[protein]-cysteine S-methyltransferase
MKPKKIYAGDLSTPLGRIRVLADEQSLLQVLLPGTREKRSRLEQELTRVYGPVEIHKGGGVVESFLKELSRYFQGDLFSFQTPVKPHGTPFQKKVWRILAKIPYGETRSYGWVAVQSGVPGGARAVGQANRRNPVPLIVPCHRIIAADGGIGGFSSGTHQKRWLLRWESRARGVPGDR